MRTFTLKKLLLTTVFFLLGSLAIHAADEEDLITEQVTIKLDKAGSLPDKIDESKKYKITNLKVIGDLNGTDFRLIRDMAGCDYQRKETIGKLSILDLSETNIVNGGDDYYNDDFSKYSCENDKIGNSTFDSCNSLTSINLPSSITEIGDYVFMNCNNLSSITIPKCVIKIGALAFFDCTALREIYADWITPIVIREDVFAQIFLSSRSLYLYVPKGAIDNYRRTDVWRDFYNIREYVPTDINNTINSYIKENSRFSLNGQRQNQPVKGLNIVKYSDGSVKKVVVK